MGQIRVYFINRKDAGHVEGAMTLAFPKQIRVGMNGFTNYYSAAQPNPSMLNESFYTHAMKIFSGHTTIKFAHHKLRQC